LIVSGMFCWVIGCLELTWPLFCIFMFSHLFIYICMLLLDVFFIYFL
jgi:hypothetical protein